MYKVYNESFSGCKADRYNKNHLSVYLQCICDNNKGKCFAEFLYPESTAIITVCFT